MTAARTVALSVVLPSRPAGVPGREMRSAFLQLCLTALDNQTLPRDDVEVVIVDDAGEVDIPGLIRRLGLRLRPVVVRNAGPPLGVSAAYNAGIERSRGEVVLLTTDDSVLAPDALAVHLAAHRARRTAAARPAYVCGVEHQYLFGVLFRNLVTGALHERDDLAVRTFGGLLGVPDLRRTAEQFGFTTWTVTPADVRCRFPDLLRRSALTPSFRDMYDDLDGPLRDLRWLSVRMGNHSVPRDTLLAVGGVEATLPGSNSDQDLGLKLQDADVDIVLDRRAVSVLIEHRRNLRAFTDHSGLRRLAQRWPRRDVQRLVEYFGRGYERSIVDYRRALAGAAAGEG